MEKDIKFTTVNGCIVDPINKTIEVPLFLRGLLLDSSMKKEIYTGVSKLWMDSEVARCYDLSNIFSQSKEYIQDNLYKGQMVFIEKEMVLKDGWELI